MRLILLVVTGLVLVGSGWGQWTEPVPMEPQFGVGVRGVWISNDNLRLYVRGGLSTLAVTARDSVNGAWGELEILPSHINFTGTQNSVCESPSGDTLYFTSDSDQRPGEEGYGWLDVYYCVRTDTGWGPAINAGDSVNGPGQEWSVNISRDGSMLLLASHGSSGEYVSHKLWYCQKHADGTWGYPTLFGESLNTWQNEQNPTLSPDNSRLFFYRQSSYLQDLLESHLVGGAWQTATPLPVPVNSLEAQDMNPCIANDGRTLWFRSDRTGQNQIYTSVDTTVLSIAPRESSRERIEGRQGLQVCERGEGFLSILLLSSVARQTNTVVLCDILGRTIVEQPVHFSLQEGVTTGRLLVGELPAGTYIISVRLRDQTLSAKYISLK